MYRAGGSSCKKAIILTSSLIPMPISYKAQNLRPMMDLCNSCLTLLYYSFLILPDHQPYPIEINIPYSIGPYHLRYHSTLQLLPWCGNAVGLGWRQFTRIMTCFHWYGLCFEWLILKRLLQLHIDIFQKL